MSDSAPQPAEMNFLSVEALLVLHQLQLERYGGSAGLRDRGLLESAVAQPQASFGGVYAHKGLFEVVMRGITAMSFEGAITPDQITAEALSPLAGRFQQAQALLGLDALRSAVVLFVNRDRTCCKLLFHDGSGVVVVYKRLDRGVFRVPHATLPGDRSVRIAPRELAISRAP